MIIIYLYYVSYCFKYAAKLQQNVSISKNIIIKCSKFLFVVLLRRNLVRCGFKMKEKWYEKY